MLTITLKVKELLYDIQNKTYLTGRAREGEDSNRFVAASNMMTSEDDENSYQVRRSLNDAFSALHTEMAEYIEKNEAESSNVIAQAIDDEEDLVMELSVPSNFNPATSATVGSAFHQFLVAKAIADWFSITNKADASEYQQQAKQALEIARRAIYKRLRPNRPSYGKNE